MRQAQLGRQAESKGGTSSDGRPISSTPTTAFGWGSAFLLAVGLVTPAAVLLHLGELRLERVQVLGGGFRSLGVVGELGQPRLEIGLVLPDRRKRGGIAAGFRVFRKKGVRLCDVLIRRENLLGLVQGERLLPFRHLRADPGLLAVGLHDGLAGGDRVLLGHHGGDPNRDSGDSEHGTDDHVVSHWSLDCAGSPSAAPERDDFSSNRHHALALCWSMIFSENRCPLFGIMLSPADGATALGRTPPLCSYSSTTATGLRHGL